MNKWIVHYLIFASVCLASCSPINSVEPFDEAQAAKLLQANYISKTTQQKISLPLPHKYNWKPIDLSYANKGSPIMLIPENEDESNWTQSFRTKIVGYINDPNITADKFVQKEIKHLKEQCAEVTGKMISQTSRAVVYRIEQCGCLEEADLIKVGKAFNGRDAVYVVYYSADSNRVSQKQIDQMSEVIASAELVNSKK